MKSITAFFHLRRQRQTLMLYVDGELPQHEMARLRRHLESCAACRQALADIRICRQLLQAGRTPPFVPTEQIWQRLVRKTSPASPAGRTFGDFFSSTRWHYLRWPVAVAGLILFGLFIREKSGKDEHHMAAGTNRPTAFAGIDFGIFLDDLHREAAPANFYKRYPAQVVKLAEAQQAIPFPLAAIEALPDSFRLDCVRVLECNGQKCIQFTCIKADKVINIFQHALGQPWTLGQYAVTRMPICNVECLMVNAQNLAAVSWQGKDSEYLAVGNLAPQDFEQVVKILR